jgi:hypothetical protein
VRVELRSVKVWSIEAKQGPLSELPHVARQAGLRPVAAGDEQDSKYGVRMPILSIPVGNYIQLALNLGNKAKVQHCSVLEQLSTAITRKAFQTRNPVPA